MGDGIDGGAVVALGGGAALAQGTTLNIARIIDADRYDPPQLHRALGRRHHLHDRRYAAVARL